ncbi:AraC family ligand binding domain-containing protein [Pseudomonas chlororaphis]|uniref:AraC family ligand binding domain-containing protein n=1 Tax=Pseudomonas chlororaphis TaxID=587753 RepID=UPI001B30C038|nr:helix-turn-helix transcriptional regulator [Pseudomonas chlororaphis]MBP5059557.1 helix-turn-helix transcriptional regulator [Pseudomonas chlororaphis]MBP5143435.1 helix-turn-helix transcriptional regulator [Pseudomonas chlororaphis]QTT98265.1 helix-turn-helix transcriptional regulator [Pseudomonas chlororaphis]
MRLADNSRTPPGTFALSRDYPSGTAIGLHCHTHGQFIHAISGVMELRAAGRLWLIPPGRGVWMPHQTVHEMRARNAVAMRTLYVAPEDSPRDMPDKPSGYVATSLLRELILRLLHDKTCEPQPSRRANLLAVLIDELEQLPANDLSLPMPLEPRLAKACSYILSDPGEDLGLTELAKRSGASVRTLSRLAHQELGCPLSVWRQQVRIFAAIPMLTAGEDGDENRERYWI